jgi:hypothetical protein
VDSDASDYEDSDDDGDNTSADCIVTKSKWTSKRTIKFYDSNNYSNKFAKMKVKAKGKAKVKNITITEQVEVEGRTETRVSKTTEVSKKVKGMVRFLIPMTCNSSSYQPRSFCFIVVG